jgi:hypothetical protein
MQQKQTDPVSPNLKFIVRFVHIHFPFSPGIVKKIQLILSPKKVCKKNQNPAIRSIAPIRMPNIEVDADNIPNIR